MELQALMSVTASPLLAIAPGPTQILRSSMSSPWQNILLEKHLSLPGERTDASINSHVVSMFTGSPSRLEHRCLSGDFVSSLNRPGTIMITPAGPAPDMKLHTSAEFIHCSLEENFTRGVVAELDHVVARPTFRAATQDKGIQRILGLLMEELETTRPSGRLYVDSLAHALTSRFLSLERNSPERVTSRMPGLVPRVLNRVREKIEANLDADLSLESLAGESGYSRAHFLRMFRASTGFTPHQYVLDLRLKRAQDCLKQKGSSIIDVAVSCGFSSQSHMTTLFRQRLEMTPGEMRRNA